MSHFVESNHKTFTVGAANIPQGSAVKLVAGLLVAATAGTDVIIGVVDTIGYIGNSVDVHLRSSAGTICVLAGGTIAVNDAVTATTAGAGLTTTTAGNQILGYALEAGVSGKFVELLPSSAKY